MKRAIIIIAAFFFLNAAVFCQEARQKTVLVLKNEIGIDVANILTFLSRKGESYLFNYKRHVSNYCALRFGLNLDIGTAEYDEIDVDTRVGYEYNFFNADQRWILYAGSDAVFSYSGSNYQSSTTTKYGLIPFLGVNYYFSKNFSISTEIGLNFYYIRDRDSKSYVAEDNSDSFSANIGSVGMILLNYHFNLGKK